MYCILFSLLLYLFPHHVCRLPKSLVSEPLLFLLLVLTLLVPGSTAGSISIKSSHASTAPLHPSCICPIVSSYSHHSAVPDLLDHILRTYITHISIHYSSYPSIDSTIHHYSFSLYYPTLHNSTILITQQSIS